MINRLLKIAIKFAYVHLITIMRTKSIANCGQIRQSVRRLRIIVDSGIRSHASGSGVKQNYLTPVGDAWTVHPGEVAPLTTKIRKKIFFIVTKIVRRLVVDGSGLKMAVLKFREK